MYLKQISPNSDQIWYMKSDTDGNFEILRDQGT